MVLTLVREARTGGRSVIFSSHVLDELDRSCDRVGIMRTGRLIDRCPRNMQQAAHELGLRRSNLFRKVRQLGMTPDR